MIEAVEILWPTACGGCDVEGRGRLCPFCRAHLRVQWAPASVEGARGTLAGAPYDTPIGRALQRAKYGPDRDLMSRLALAWAAEVAPWAAGDVFDAIVPAPSPWTRRLRRGFSPATVLATALSARIDVPVVHALTLRPGRANAGLGAVGRRTNLHGRVRCARPVEGRVLLVDDVVTTGATAGACIRELLGTSARSVWVSALCAAGTHGDTA